MKFLKIFYLILFLGMLCSCNHANSSVDQLMMDWIGREFKFPNIEDSEIMNGDLEMPYDFTIIAYIDSTSCAPCRMHLPNWELFLNRIEELFPEKNVGYLMVIDTKRKRDIKNILKKEHFAYPIIVDSDSKFNKLNKFTSTPEFQTILINKDNKVMAIGDPIQNIKVKRLFINIIGGRDYNDNTFINDYCDTRIFDFGDIKPNHKVSHVFSFKNDTDSVISIEEIYKSCECVSVNFSDTLLLPNKTYKIMVNFMDSVKGEFTRTIEVIYSNEKKAVINVTGVII